MPRLQAVYDDLEYKDKLLMYGLDVGQFTHLRDTEVWGDGNAFRCSHGRLLASDAETA